MTGEGGWLFVFGLVCGLGAWGLGRLADRLLAARRPGLARAVEVCGVVLVWPAALFCLFYGPGLLLDGF